MRKQGGFYPSPPEGMQCPMEFALGHRFFEFMEVDDEQRQAFNDYMAARREGYQLQRFDIYPMADRIESLAIGDKKQVLICDVGGGQGHELAKLLARFPEVTGRLVLEDLESTFDGLSLTGKIEKLPHDFFQAQPVKGRFSARTIVDDLKACRLADICRCAILLYASDHA